MGISCTFSLAVINGLLPVMCPMDLIAFLCFIMVFISECYAIHMRAGILLLCLRSVIRIFIIYAALLHI